MILFFVLVNTGSYGTINFKTQILLTQVHMGLGISKRYTPGTFHPISAKLYEDIGYYGGIQAVIFMTIDHVLKFLCHF